MQGDFSSYTDQIIQFVKAKGRSGRAIFNLDQCGYDGVPFERIRAIFSELPNAEVILTFAADFLIDYLREERPNRRLKCMPDLDLDAMASSVEQIDPEWRRLIQLELHQEVLKASGALLHALLHPVRGLPQGSVAPPPLGTSSGKGRDDRRSLGTAQLVAHYGGPGLKMLGYVPKQDVAVTAVPISRASTSTTRRRLDRRRPCSRAPASHLRTS